MQCHRLLIHPCLLRRSVSSIPRLQSQLAHHLRSFGSDNHPIPDIWFLSQTRKGLCRQASALSSSICGKVFRHKSSPVLLRRKVFQRICRACSIEKRDVCRHLLFDEAFPSDMETHEDFLFDPSVDRPHRRIICWGSGS